MKNINFYSRIGLFNLNPTIEVYEDKTILERRKTSVAGLTKDLFELSKKYDGRVNTIHLFGAQGFLSRIYTELQTKFAMSDIKILIDQEREI